MANVLDTSKRAQILNMLVEGMSMRSVSRITGVSINTVSKLLVAAGNACAEYHDNTVRGVAAARVQCDEIWSFVGAKQKNVKDMKAPVDGAGDVWTWTAIDADSKLIISYLVGGRDGRYAAEFMDDVASRLANRVQLTTDGHKAYLEAVEGAFGCDVDYAQLVKIYGAAPDSFKGRYSPADCTGIKKNPIEGEPDETHINTSYVERMNLNIRMGNRRFTRLTNAFSKKVDNHLHMLSLYFMHYNFCRIHKSLRVTPAMEAGISDVVRDMEWVVGLIDARAPAPKKRGPYKKKKFKLRHYQELWPFDNRWELILRRLAAWWPLLFVVIFGLLYYSDVSPNDGVLKIADFEISLFVYSLVALLPYALILVEFILKRRMPIRYNPRKTLWEKHGEKVIFTIVGAVITSIIVGYLK